MANGPESIHSTQTKFNLYFASLVFTLLGLSIQTARFGTSLFVDIAELAGWIALLLSGVFFLSYLEWVPIVRGWSITKDGQENHLVDLEAKRQQGVRSIFVVDQQREQPLVERIANTREAIERLGNAIKKREASGIKKYAFARWAFVAGLAAILAARSYSPVMSIAGAMRAAL